MKYSSGAAFRQALEARLRAQSLSTHIALVRLRKLVAFDRFLARLTADQPDRWLLKGGLALQFRLGSRARTTQDMDLLLTSPLSDLDLHQALVESSMRDLSDWFEFQVKLSSEMPVMRFPVQSLLDGRPFETFHLDVGLGDPVIETPDLLSGPPLLAFANIRPAVVSCYPLTQQIAEKVHALTRTYPAGESTRIKDWIDILLIAEMGNFTARSLWLALEATFTVRQTHPLSSSLPVPPASWEPTFREIRREVGLSAQSLADATDMMARFIDPVLARTADGRWDPARWRWR